MRDMTASPAPASRAPLPTFDLLLACNCVRHADPGVADQVSPPRRCGRQTRRGVVRYLLKARCAAMDAKGAWAVVDDMDKVLGSAQAHAALATVSSLTGDVEKARSACEAARQGEGQQCGDG